MTGCVNGAAVNQSRHRLLRRPRFDTHPGSAMGIGPLEPTGYNNTTTRRRSSMVSRVSYASLPTLAMVLSDTTSTTYGTTAHRWSLQGRATTTIWRDIGSS